MLADPCLQGWHLAFWEVNPLLARRVAAATTAADADAARGKDSSGCKVLTDQDALRQPLLRRHMVQYSGQHRQWKVKEALHEADQ
jgi:hypothetical protein